ncbi:MAG: asparaginase [Bacilli bacterium]|nr:asparaginase [Bacilli bacterium]MBN2696781.1 asparaginase [Bacilli bacterium]
MGKIFLVFTGGTITMKMDDSNHSLIPSLSASDIMSALLNGFDGYDLEVIEYAKLPSPSITPAIMLDLSNMVGKILVRDDVTGVVIVHGTDTLEETAFFLDLVLNTDKPVVVTGSMKSSSDLGYDGINNLVASILVCLSPDAINKGVLVVMNDKINAASEVTKTNTLSLDSFQSLDYGPLGIIDDRKVIFYRSVNYRHPVIPTESLEENVFLLKTYSGMDSRLLFHLVDNEHAKGIVIEALGRGNVPPMMLDGIIHVLKLEIPIVITSRCPSGRVYDTYGYVGGGKHLTSLGCIIAPNLNGQKARLFLMVALANNISGEEIKKLLSV